MAAYLLGSCININLQLTVDSLNASVSIAESFVLVYVLSASEGF